MGIYSDCKPLGAGIKVLGDSFVSVCMLVCPSQLPVHICQASQLEVASSLV